MKRLALAIALICAAASPGFGAYTAIRTVTIDHTKVGSSNSTNFPMLFAGTYSYLATIANGGLVTNASGFDIAFTSDAACATKLNWETVSWSASSGAVYYWVEIPTLSHTVDTVIYLCYANSSITTDQSNKTGTWDASAQFVYHLQENGHPYLDSSANALSSNVVANYNDPTQTTGLRGNAQSFVTASLNGINLQQAPSTGSPPNGINADVSISGWFKSSTLPAVAGCFFDSRIAVYTVGVNNYLDSSGKFNGQVHTPTTGSYSIGPGSSNVFDGSWHMLAMTASNTSTFPTVLYVDGASQATASGGTIAPGLRGSSYGLGECYTASFPLTAVIQELRVSNTVRSADWVLSEFNTFNSPSTFYTVGSPIVTVGTGAGGGVFAGGTGTGVGTVAE